MLSAVLLQRSGHVGLQLRRRYLGHYAEPGEGYFAISCQGQNLRAGHRLGSHGRHRCVQHYQQRAFMHHVFAYEYRFDRDVRDGYEALHIRRHDARCADDTGFHLRCNEPHQLHSQQHYNWVWSWWVGPCGVDQERAMGAVGL